jgi:hypothetical protein
MQGRHPESSALPIVVSGFEFKPSHPNVVERAQSDTAIILSVKKQKHVCIRID